MRLSRVLVVLAPLLVSACAETPRCVDRGTSDRPNVVLECNAGKVAVCSTATYDPATGEGTYDPNTGGLVRVPATVGGTQLGCDAYPGYPDPTRCRTPPTCPGAGQAAVCPGGAQPVCVLGRNQALDPPDAGAPDSGTAALDAGDDAGAADAGAADSGAADAGAADAGAPDAGTSGDAGA